MPDSIDEQLTKYLTDAHSIEEQALQQLRTAPQIAKDGELARVYAEHYTETQVQERRVRERLEARGSSPSLIKDIGMRLGGFNIGGFFGVQPDTPAKLAGFAFAFEHLEIAAYELLRWIAEGAGDQETVAVADRILVEERRAADRVAGTWDAAMDAALAKVGASSAS